MKNAGVFFSLSLMLLFVLCCFMLLNIQIEDYSMLQRRTKNDFETIQGQTYYFDANGYMVTGWKKINNKDYFFNDSGVMVKDAWQGAYYLGSDGAMLTNTFTKDGYYVGANGAYYTNRWFKDQGKDYYVNGSGKLVKNAWQGAYYLGKDGVMLTNAFTPDGY